MKIFKNRIFLVVLTAIVFTGVGVIAANTINASQVVYTNRSNEDVPLKSALDNVYNNLDTKIALNTFGDPQYATSYGNRIADRTVTTEITKGKYIVVDYKGYNWSTAATTWPSEHNANLTNSTYDNLACASGNCTITNLARYYNRVRPSNKYNSEYLQLSIMTYAYYVEIREDTDTISAACKPTAYNNNAQTETLMIIPIN